MKIEVSVPGFAGLMREIEGDIAKAATSAMRDTMPVAKQELREQVTAAGLGTRLANTWRGDVYPKSRQSISPAGYIHSNAPDIVDSFVRGAQIVPINGGRYLAIPTDRVPLAGRRGASKRMTPPEVEASFNQDLIIRPGRNGHLLAFIDPSRARGRSGKGSRVKSQQAKLVLMFTLVRSTRMPKLLDLDGPAERWASSYAAALGSRLGTA